MSFVKKPMEKLSSTDSASDDDSVTIDVDTIDERKSSDPSCVVELSKIASTTRDASVSVESLDSPERGDARHPAMLVPVRIISDNAPHVGHPFYYTHFYNGMRALLQHPAGIAFLVLALTRPRARWASEEVPEWPISQ